MFEIITAIKFVGMTQNLLQCLFLCRSSCQVMLYIATKLFNVIHTASEL